MHGGSRPAPSAGCGPRDETQPLLDTTHAFARLHSKYKHCTVLLLYSDLCPARERKQSNSIGGKGMHRAQRKLTVVTVYVAPF